MTNAVYIAMYAGLAIFWIGCLLRIREYARLPFHLRWELYPVAHEEPDRAKYGGSYFETGQWWLSPQAVNHRGEISTMFREIAFLKGLWENNRRLWPASYLFHLGLYVSIAAACLGGLGAAIRAYLSGAILVQAAVWLLLAGKWLGAAGIVCVLAGAVLLLVRRIVDPALKNYTKPADLFNLVFFLAAFGFLAAAWLENPSAVAAIIRGAWRFDGRVPVAAVPAIGVVLACALVAYIPYTHMAHFIAKYFTWHSVRWDDRRNDRGSAVEAKIVTSLGYRPTWAAPHMGADGKRTWGEIAATNPNEEKQK